MTIPEIGKRSSILIDVLQRAIKTSECVPKEAQLPYFFFNAFIKEVYKAIEKDQSGIIYSNNFHWISSVRYEFCGLPITRHYGIFIKIIDMDGNKITFTTFWNAMFWKWNKEVPSGMVTQ